MIIHKLWTVYFTLIFLAEFVSFLWLERLNNGYLRRAGDHVPPSFSGFINGRTLAEANTYQLEKSHLSMVRKTVVNLALLIVILSGLLPILDKYSVNPEIHYIWAGLIFFVGVGLAFFVLELPFDYYGTFVIEEKYGFNKSDLKTWVVDNIKSELLSIVFLICVMTPLLWTIVLSPDYWWLWGFIVVAGVQFVIMIIYPVLIAPLFNKFEPLEDQDLVQKVEELVKSVGMKTGGIFKMDAGRRSTHSNAYFTGFGKTKRVVLFDTLIDRHTKDEIIAVLAHELGHFKLRHIWKLYVVGQVALLAGLYVTHKMLNWNLLYYTFHIETAQSYIALFLIGIFWAKIGYFMQPLSAAWSRSFERQADAFAVKLQKTPQPLAIALKKMGVHNLSNLTPHPFYAWFYYSHPPLPERVASLEDPTS